MIPRPNQHPCFETERFVVIPLSPAEARKLTEVLLQDERLAERVPWLEEKTKDGAQREAFRIELQAAAGQIKVWSVVSRDIQVQIAAIIARNSLEGIDVEVLVATLFSDDGVSDEAGVPVVEWLENNAEVIQNFPTSLH